eukprot:CAMPEP_0168338040 /NCGR_PEP_ID=MMETSP0213-20121227/12572_1 /TAXON_ID=151035 /ORGANISM="Euplotes harpa, Strain FSP1.4" /LENGTH=76 /DNA_ID=CAMNT_0008343691 /DNA_START=133 /DNA_END=363 /DNA_ORIENTATION=+
MSPFGENPDLLSEDDNEKEPELSKDNKENKRVIKRGRTSDFDEKEFKIDVLHLNREVSKVMKVSGPYDYVGMHLRN